MMVREAAYANGDKNQRPVGSAVVRKHQEDGTTVGSYQPDRRPATIKYELEFNDGARECVRKLGEEPASLWSRGGEIAPGRT
jgi:hypothetical protein